MIPLSQLGASARPEGTLIAWRLGNAITLGDWCRDVAHNAQRLRYAAPQRALLLTDDSYWFAVGLMALLQAGKEVVLPPAGHAGALQGSADLAELLVSDEPASGNGAAMTLERAPGGAAPVLPPLDAERCRLDFFTSGSTGERKRIPKTLAQLEREVAVLEAHWGAALGQANFLSTVPHQHVFGMTFGLLWPLMAGRPFHALRYLSWEALLAALPPGAVVVSSPAHLHRLDGCLPLAPERRPSLMLTAGAPLFYAAARQCGELFGSLPVEIFGSTETGAIAHRRQRGEDEPWQPLPGVRITAAEDGTLAVQSPFLAGGDPVHTADMVEPAADGYFRFRGRSDRIVKIEGMRVSLPRLEQQLAVLPWVADAVVLPITEGERLFLGVAAVLSEAGRTSLAELGQFRFERLLRRELGRAQDQPVLPRRWRFVPDLPLDDMGKRERSSLEALLELPGIDADAALD